MYLHSSERLKKPSKAEKGGTQKKKKKQQQRQNQKMKRGEGGWKMRGKWKEKKPDGKSDGSR